MVWVHGGVAFQGVWGTVLPTPADFARAQRTLMRIESYPQSSRRLFGDADTWLIARSSRLERAKRMVQAGKLLAEAAGGAILSPISRDQIADLVDLELNCADLPSLPSHFLCRGRFVSDLLAIASLTAESVPQATLAAMIAGAANRRRSGDSAAQHLGLSAFAERAYRFGTTSGLPDNPALYVRLLADPAGWDLARVVVTSGTHRWSLSPGEIAGLLDRGASGTDIVALAEGIQDSSAVRRAVMEAVERAGPPRKRQKPDPDAGRPLVRRVADSIQETLVAIARETGSLKAFQTARELALWLLSLGPIEQRAGKAVVQILGSAKQCAPELQARWVEILTECRDSIFDLSRRAAAGTLRGEIGAHANWLKECYVQKVKPLAGALRQSGDPELVRQIIKRNLYEIIRGWDWPDRARLRFAVSLAVKYELPDRDLLFWNLGRVVRGARSAQEVSRAVRPILEPLRDVEPNVRGHLFEEILDALPTSCRALQKEAEEIRPCMEVLVRFARAEEGAYCLCDRAVAAAQVLTRAVGDFAPEWLGWLLDYANGLPRERSDRLTYEEFMRDLFPAVVALSQGSLLTFQSLTRALISRPPDTLQYSMESAADLIRRLPALAAPIAEMMPAQPKRCVDILERLGLLPRLGPEAERLLDDASDALGRSSDAVTLNSEWSELTDWAPALREEAARYGSAQTFLGRPVTMPASVKKALKGPQALKSQLGYLTRELQLHPERDDLRPKAEALQRILEDPQKVEWEAFDDAIQKLRQALLETEMECIEAAIGRAAAARLEKTVGAVPPDLAVTNDLLNGVLLTVDIRQNRKLLTRLLRAFLEGDTDWREQHPGNKRFIAKLAEAGVDTSIWLSSMPKRYRFSGAGGRWARLRLESDPLAILQMGNYFDTCLSRGHYNAFSTVANACELNKRVIYARDDRGRVIGRKVIGINEEGNLVGFYTYTSLAGPEEAETLRRIFYRYCREFARRCRLEMADFGTIPKLFAQAWYDDGAVAWKDSAARTDELDSTNNATRRDHGHRSRSRAGA